MGRRHDADGVAAEAEVRRLVLADDPGVAPLRDPVLHAQPPVHGVHEQAAQPLALEVRGGAHRRREHPRRLAACAGVGPGPGDRDHRVVLRSFDRRIVGRHAGENGAEQQDVRVVAQVPEPVDVGRAPDVVHAAQDRMARRGRRDDAAGALLAVTAVMVDPGVAEHLLAESAGPGLAAKAPVRVRAIRVALVGEGVGRGAQAHDRPPRLDVVDDVLHLLVGKFAKTCGDHHQVGVRERFEARDVRLLLRVDRPGLGVYREQHDALETVPHGEQLAQHRHRFLGAVFLVAGDEDDLAAGAGAVAARIVHPLGLAAERRRVQEGQEHRAQGRAGRKKTIHSHFWNLRNQRNTAPEGLRSPSAKLALPAASPTLDRHSRTTGTARTRRQP